MGAGRIKEQLSPPSFSSILSEALTAPRTALAAAAAAAVQPSPLSPPPAGFSRLFLLAPMPLSLLAELAWLDGLAFS